MTDPTAKSPVLPKSAARLNIDQLMAPPRQLAAKVKSRRNAGFEGPRPWGGDKIGFEPVPVGKEHKQAAATVERIIESARADKRIAKAKIEKDKEFAINAVRAAATILAKAKLCPSKDIPPGSPEAKAQQKMLFEKLQTGELKLPVQYHTIALHVGLLNTEGVVKLNKKILHDFHNDVGQYTGWNWELLAKQFEGEGLVVTKQGTGHEIVVKGDGGLVPLYQVSWGADRVTAKPGEGGVFQQKGYADKPASVSRRKEYVEDANGVLTRRFVTRAISYRHLANMMGVNVTDAGKVEQSAFPPGQRPRGKGDRFDANTETFNVNSAAVVDPANWEQRYEATGQPEVMPESGASVVGARSRSPLDANSPMDVNERTSMQVRNGSSKVAQTMLSTASTQEPVAGQGAKVIRGNKGERFDNTAENVAVLEIDLALAKQAGIQFVNQHSSDSHEYKVAYDRYKDAKTAEIKRVAKEELDEYIYSGRKNREVTLTEIPNKIITKIKLTGGTAVWDGVGLNLDAWLPFASPVFKAIVQYMHPGRLAALHHRAQQATDDDHLAAAAKL